MKGVIFPALPYNTDRNYIMATAKCGCEIYMPVISGYDLKLAKQEWQEFLNSHPIDEEQKELA